MSFRTLLTISLAANWFAIAPGAGAQTPAGEVAGRVLVAGDSVGLAGATVAPEGTGAIVVTDEEGRFTLEGLGIGNVTLRFRAFGFADAVRTISVAASGPATIEVFLERSPIYLDTIVVTGTLDERAASEALRPSRSLSGRELERSLGVTLAETLESQAGLATVSMGPAPARPVIRGLGGDRILILEDGQRVGDVSAGGGDHAVATEGASARRVEVLRGPAALFYGSNALGGVVNVVRDEIPQRRSGAATGHLGLQAQSVYSGGSASADVVAPLGGLMLRAESSYRTTGDVDTPEGALANTQIDTWSAGAGASRVGDWGYAGVAVRQYSSDYGIPPDSISGHPGGVDIDLDRFTVRGDGEVVGGVGPFEHFRAFAAYTSYEHREIEASGAIGTAFEQTTGSVEIQGHNGALGPFESGGVGARAEHRNYRSDNGRDVVDAGELYLAAFAVEEWRSGPLDIQLGTRFDHVRLTPRNPVTIRGIEARERTFNELSASVAGLYEVSEGLRLGTSFARSVRTPSAEELFSQGPHLAAYAFEVGNPELSSETAYGVDAFVRLERPSLRAELVGFVNAIDDFSYQTNTGEQRGSLFVYRSVNTNARFWGGELSLDWSPHPDWVIGGTASAVNATNLELDDPLPLIPPLHGQVAARYESEVWFAEALLDWSGRQDRIPERPELPANSPGYCDETPTGELCRPVPGDYQPTDGYATVGGSIGYRLVRGGAIHSLTLRVENATDSTYRNHLSRIKALAPEPGVGFSLLYRLSF